jgi:Na+-transporting methylmalonyl-CoA/oxaloacetate decarboxylase gamma subunit
LGHLAVVMLVYLLLSLQVETISYVTNLFLKPPLTANQDK